MKRTRLGLRSAVFPDVFGAEDDPADSGAVEGNDHEGEEQSSEGEDEESKGSGDPEKKIAALNDEKNRHYEARKSAEKELAELREWKEEQERKDKSELENVSADLEKERTARIEAESKLQDLAIKYAFRSLDDLEFHNPERAIRLLDLSEVSVKDGEVDIKALKAAAKHLADEEPYLVKSKKEKQEKGDPPPRSGNNPTGNNPPKGEIDKKKLQSKYPALRGR